MSSNVVSVHAAQRSLAPLIATNAVTVGSMYLIQALVSQAAAEFGPSTAVLLMPGAALAGYAIGVGLSASIARDLTVQRGLKLHLAWLTMSLVLAAVAWTPLLQLSACLLVGLGCSLTQRLLAVATNSVPIGERAQAIGWVIAGGLCGIVAARASAPLVAALGGRPLLLIAAGLIALFGSATGRGRDGIAPLVAYSATPDPVWSLWRRLRDLRRAGIQQAAVFAAYNAGWAVFPRCVANQDAATAALLMGAVAGLGAAAALISGRLCRRRDPADIATSGAIAVVVAGALALFAAHLPRGSEVAIAVLDIGTQVALVANQARAQACATNPAERGRIAATVTTLGFVGGAAGSVLGNLWR